MRKQWKPGLFLLAVSGLGTRLVGLTFNHCTDLIILLALPLSNIPTCQVGAMFIKVVFSEGPHPNKTTSQVLAMQCLWEDAFRVEEAFEIRRFHHKVIIYFHSKKLAL